MHKEVREFFLSVRCLYPDYFRNKKVLDVGSMDINGNNLSFFTNCEYTGIDVVHGKNVNVVGEVHTLDRGFNKYYDVIISSECFEHDMYLDKSLNRITEVLAPKGLFLFTCATTGRGEHGTQMNSPRSSPTSQLPHWNNYYKNVTTKMVCDIIDLEKYFNPYMIKRVDKDLQFYGIKR